jgi:hypothetical protein
VAAAYQWFPLSFRRISAFASKERCMQQIESDRVILVLGGVRSGKSRYAQRLAERSHRVTFVATAERRDVLIFRKAGLAADSGPSTTYRITPALTAAMRSRTMSIIMAPLPELRMEYFSRLQSARNHTP